MRLLLLWIGLCLVTSIPMIAGNIDGDGAAYNQTTTAGYTRVYEGSANGSNYTEFKSALSLSGNKTCTSASDGRWPVSCLDTGDTNSGVVAWGDGDDATSTENGNNVCAALGLNCQATHQLDGTNKLCGFDHVDAYFYAMCY